MSTEIAKMTLEHIGGARALAMLGVRRNGLTARARGISVQYRGGRRGRNRFSVDLMDDDLYRVQIEQHRAGRFCTRTGGVIEERTDVVESFDGVGAESLQETIERAIELRLSL